MPHHPRIETKEYAAFTTSRCKHSELWFANNRKFQNCVLALIAKYSEMYNVMLYAIAIEGSHVHFLADYPDENCSEFKRTLNSMIARNAPRYCVKYHNYKFWERRYSKELVPHHPDDMIEKFLYTVLQPVKDGLVEKLSEYPGYNCMLDAIQGKVRKYELVNWTTYNRAKRGRKEVDIKDHTEEYTLKFKKIPGLEHLSLREYEEYISSKVEERRQKLVQERKDEGKGFVGRRHLLHVEPGTKAKNPKKSTRFSFRPRVHSVCPERREEAMRFYFKCLDDFKKASRKFRDGSIDTDFPSGMYRPHLKSKLIH